MKKGTHHTEESKLKNSLLRFRENKDMNNIRLGIATPSTGTIKTKTVESLIKLFKKYPDAIFLSHEGSILHHMRERLIKKAIELDCTHLLFVDSDMVFETDALQGLLEANKDIVGANYNRRKLPLEATAELLDGSFGDDLVQATSIGTGFMLIKLSVFEFLPEPWFFFESNGDGDLATGEDYFFCRLARDKGFEVYADLSVKAGHLGDYIY